MDILALAFSRAAADELRGRLVRALGPRAASWGRDVHGSAPGSSAIMAPGWAHGGLHGLDREDTRLIGC